VNWNSFARRSSMEVASPLGDAGTVEGGGGVQVEVLNWLVLSCSEKLFAPPASLIVLVALSKNPTAVDIEPAARAAKPPPPIKLLIGHSKG
jgi:hypothetical protein